MSRYICLLLLLVAVSCVNQSSVDQAAVSAGPEKGTLVIAGGSLTDTAIFHKFMELAGGPDAPVVILTTARRDEVLNDTSFLMTQTQRFHAYGFNNFTFLHTRSREKANADSFVRSIQEASGVWILGGRQWRLADSYLGTKTMQGLSTLLDRGGVIGGSSAGATILGSYLVRGDTKTNTIMMGDHEEGFGFLSNTAIDQHLLTLNRQFDLFEVIEKHPHLLGIGLDENTAIVVRGNEFQVYGQSYVAIYDGSFIREVRDKADWSESSIEQTKLQDNSRQFYFLKPGDKYDLVNRTVLP